MLAGQDRSGLCLKLTGGPAEEYPDGPIWFITDPANGPIRTMAAAPDHVWLCNLDRGASDWRVHLDEPYRRHTFGHAPVAALYWLERERDDSPKRTVDGAHLYTHVPDDEVDEYLARSAGE